jgi:hypothetical protein
MEKEDEGGWKAVNEWLLDSLIQVLSDQALNLGLIKSQKDVSILFDS